jgi:hypothetical protein
MPFGQSANVNDSGPIPFLTSAVKSVDDSLEYFLGSKLLGMAGCPELAAFIISSDDILDCSTFVIVTLYCPAIAPFA